MRFLSSRIGGPLRVAWEVDRGEPAWHCFAALAPDVAPNSSRRHRSPGGGE